MTDFKWEWKPQFDQVYAEEENGYSDGEPSGYGKIPGAGFKLDTSRSLTLTNSRMDVTWKSAIEILNGYFRVGSREAPVDTLNIVNEGVDGKTFAKFTSRAKCEINALAYVFAGETAPLQVRILDNSETVFNQISGIDSSGFQELTIFSNANINIGNNANCKFNIYGMSYATNTNFTVINNASLAIDLEVCVIDTLTDHVSFTLGGFQNEVGDASVGDAVISFSTPLTTFPMSFMELDPNKLSFNFNTKVSESNKGKFVFYGLAGFGASALLNRGFIRIDDVPIPSKDIDKYLVVSKLNDGSKTTGVSFKLRA